MLSLIPMRPIIFLLSLLAVFPSSAAEKKPNVLLLFADDLGRYASAYSDTAQPSPNDVVSTPVFDRIAREGARFDNAFVSVPSCTPSRGALYTGRHFFRNGSFSQLHSRWEKGAPDPSDAIVGMPEMLARAGYHIGWSHKWHIPERLMRGKDQQYSPFGNRISTFSQNVTKNPDARDDIFVAVRGNFRAFLADLKPEQPFFYSFNPTNTHRQWVRGSGKELWGIDPDKLKGKLPPFLPDNEIVREDYADYLGEVMAFDQACGMIIKELERMGELDDTLIVISGDHGIPGFPRGKCNVHDYGSRVLLTMRWPGHIEPGRVVKSPVSLVDLAPTFLAAAGTSSPDDPDGQNLLPALATDGSEKDLRGWALIGREVHFSRAREGYLPYPVRALRTPGFLYVKNFKPDRWPLGDPKHVTGDAMPDFEMLCHNTRAAFADIDASPTKAWMIHHRNDADVIPLLEFAWEKRPDEEFYDLQKDPFQVTNLAGDPAYADSLERLRGQLIAELQEAKDPRLDDAFDRPPYLNKAE